ncbi:hypothetical protein ACIA74_42710 [Streptomyces sp. NPDC051658]
MLLRECGAVDVRVDGGEYQALRFRRFRGFRAAPKACGILSVAVGH